MSRYIEILKEILIIWNASMCISKSVIRDWCKKTSRLHFISRGCIGSMIYCFATNCLSADRCSISDFTIPAGNDRLFYSSTIKQGSNNKIPNTFLSDSLTERKCSQSSPYFKKYIWCWV